MNNIDRHKKWIVFLLCTIMGGVSSFCQTNRFRVMEYNVENLFDCKHDSLKNDTEFLPTALRKWDYRKYREKLIKLGKVIVAVGGEQVPDLVALCEVENEHVLTDLTRYTPLKEVGYRFLTTDSPDERGIDVALLYQPGRFKVLQHRAIGITPMKGQRPTRDILHVCGMIVTGDTLDVFVCHLPSRATGARQSRPHRAHVATRLKTYCDSLLNVRKAPRILITGDFNDTPEGFIMQKILQTDTPGEKVSPLQFYHLIAPQVPGTYRYHGEWSVLDHFLVSGLLLDKHTNFHLSPDSAIIVAFPFLLEPDRKYGGYKPYRTYIGPRYNGGVSDPLPIRVDFVIK